MSTSKRSDVSDDLWSPFNHSFVSSLSVPSNQITESITKTSNDTSSLSFPSGTSAFALLSIDWKETPEAHLFKADLPGLKKGEVMVDVEDGNVVVQISVEHARGNEQKTDLSHCDNSVVPE